MEHHTYCPNCNEVTLDFIKENRLGWISLTKTRRVYCVVCGVLKEWQEQ